MANFPFVGDYAIRINCCIPVIPASTKFYCQLDGKITAVKIIAWGTFGRVGNNPMTAYLLQTPKGVVEIESWKVKLFCSAKDCIEFINTNRYELIHHLKQQGLEKIMAALGYEMRNHEVIVYEWNMKDCCTWCHSTGVKVWSDVDGIHADVQMGYRDHPDRKLYKTSAECTTASAEVLDFDDEDVPATMGEYTIKREFTVKATSEEEANRIIDEKIKM